MDTMFLYDKRPDAHGKQRDRHYAVINFVDLATSYHKAHAFELDADGNVTSRAAADALEKKWIEHFGAPDFVVCDEGGENKGQEMVDMCAFYNIEIRMIAGQAPWQNGFVERHGASLKWSLIKMMQDSMRDLPDLVPAAVTAKNQMCRYHNHAPEEWFLGRSRKITLDVLGDEIPIAGLSLLDDDEYFREKYDVMCQARDAFESQRSKMAIRRALTHRNRPTRGPFDVGQTV